MKWNYIELSDDDPKARDWIRTNLDVCAYSHTLSKKLLQRFSSLTGSKVAIIPDWVHLDQLVTYCQGSVPPPDEPTYGPGDRPLDRLVVFVNEYLQTTPHAVAVCENSGQPRKTLDFWTWGPKPRTSFYGAEEVYYLVDRSADLELIDGAVGDTLGHFGVAVCSSCQQLPAAVMPDDTFLDEVVQNTIHILLPAFDNDGYMIWTPD